MTARPLFIKEALAAGRLGEAIGGAMSGEWQEHQSGNATRGQIPQRVGRQAARDAAMVSLGRKAILYRHGNFAAERAGAVDDLLVILMAERDHKGRARIPFAEDIMRCVVGVALDELAADMCLTCRGAGQVQMAKVEGRQPMTVCPSCGGASRRKYNEDDRISALAREWVRLHPADEADLDPVTPVAKELRAHGRIRLLLGAIGFARGKLLEAERIAVEQTRKMLGRWGWRG